MVTKVCTYCAKVLTYNNVYRTKNAALPITCRRCGKTLKGRLNNNNAKANNFRQRLKSFGLSAEQYTVMLLTQNYSCLLCNTVFNGKKNKVCIDHCHQTDAVRGLLCSGCNSGLGMFKENITALKNAVDYLIKHKV